ncbi:MAG: AraC family transcriptional regulator [Marinobacterium sp.]|nr:AraC family transcriptional regulator [Marinobacterium sp.]
MAKGKTQQHNRFHYVRSQHLEQVAMLKAQMSDFTYSKHAHAEYSFGVTLAGRQDFFASGAFYRSQPGTVMVFNPGQVHDGHSGVDDPLQYRMLYIHPQQLEPLLSVAGVHHNRDFQVADVLINDPQLRQSILSLVQLFDQPDPDHFLQEAQLYQLAARIAQRYGQYSPDRVVRRIDSLLLQARDYIHAHLTDEISLEQISRQVNLSKYHFLRLFRQQFGMTPHQYIINCRVSRAREALEAGMALNDVVYRYGFTDLSHLNRRFKPIYGMTPRQYQQQLYHC